MLIGKKFKNLVTGNLYEVVDETDENVFLKGIGEMDMTFMLPLWMLRNYEEVQ